MHASKDVKETQQARDVILQLAGDEPTAVSLRRKMVTSLPVVKLLTLVLEPGTPVKEIHDLLKKTLDYLSEKDQNMPLVKRFEQSLAEALGIVAEGEESLAAEAIADVFHRRLPVQRGQLMEWMRSRPPTSE